LSAYDPDNFSAYHIHVATRSFRNSCKLCMHGSRSSNSVMLHQQAFLTPNFGTALAWSEMAAPKMPADKMCAHS
jgi:hypothetical protein